MSYLAITMTGITLAWLYKKPCLSRLFISLGSAVVDLITIGRTLDLGLIYTLQECLGM